MPPELILDPRKIDTSKILADRAAIRLANLHRHEMEQLDAVVLLELEKHLVAGFKDVRDDEFWVRGHMPGFALLPGVLMCESAAQLISYYGVQAKFPFGDFMAFGGMEEVRFRGMVRPGDRFLLVGRGKKIHRRQTVFEVQGFVGSAMVFHADIIGMPFHTKDAGPARGEGES